MTAQVITFPLSPAERRHVLERLGEVPKSTDPADYPGQDVFGPVLWDGRKIEEKP